MLFAFCAIQWLIVGTAFPLPAIRTLLSVAVLGGVLIHSSGIFSWRVWSCLHSDSKNHISSQMEKLGTPLFHIHSNPPYSQVCVAKSDLEL